MLMINLVKSDYLIYSECTKDVPGGDRMEPPSRRIFIYRLYQSHCCFLFGHVDGATGGWRLKETAIEARPAIPDVARQKSPCSK
jgi:hypothetical protein